jgi:hypothetical protein
VDLYPMKIYLTVTCNFDKVKTIEIFSKDFLVPPNTRILCDKWEFGDLHVCLIDWPVWNVSESHFIGSSSSYFNGYTSKEISEGLVKSGWAKV